MREGRLTINGRSATLGCKVRPGVDHVSLDGRALKIKKKVSSYWLMRKPRGTITSHHDPEGRPLVFDLPSVPRGLISVGRLDFDTEGLLLLSNDGDWVNRLAHPSSELPRQYAVKVGRKLKAHELRAIERGVMLSDGPLRRVKVELHQSTNRTKGVRAWYRVTVYEGRNRLVRRLFEYFHISVLRLVRVAFGPIQMPPGLAAGTCISLRAPQLRQIEKALKSPETTLRTASEFV